MSRIAVIGTGYVGLTTAVCFADLGNDVVGIDIDATRVKRLNAADLPFYERGLQELLSRNVSTGRLRFTEAYPSGIPSAEFIFIAVGTPMDEDGDADLSSVRRASSAIAAYVGDHAVIVNKSTVPIGTGDLVSDIVHRKRRTLPARLAVVSNPEFLREGSAVRDFMEPDRIVLGSHDRQAATRVAELYKPLGAPVIITDVYSAEIIKYASNAFLATKISFINAVALVCEILGADVKVVAQAMGMDHRIGPSYLDAGTGYGGSCLPKDIMALARTFRRLGSDPHLLTAVMEINRNQPRRIVEKLIGLIGSLDGLKIGLLGLSFKPNTDDIREAPSIAIIEYIDERGAVVCAYDPAAMERARAVVCNCSMKEDAYAVAGGADALVVVTEWSEFCQLDLNRIKRAMHTPVIVDARNIYDPTEMRAMGFIYAGVGR